MQDIEQKSKTSEVEASKPNPEILDNYDPSSLQVESIKVSSQVTRGPLPPAEEYSVYVQANPKAGDRILDYADNEQRHRQNMDFKMADASISEMERGQNYAFLLTLALLVLAGIISIFSNPWVGGFVGFSAAVSGIAAKLIDGRLKK